MPENRSLHVDRNPCASCPYRCDTPTGVWHPDEYEKLRSYDDDAPEPALGIFLCHHSTTTGHDTVCRGWLTVHCESVAARLAVMQGEISNDDRYAKVTVALYPDGKTAAAAGMSGVEHPDSAAQHTMDKIVARRERARQR